MKYKLIAFDLDQTLVKERTIDCFANEFGFGKELENLRSLWKENRIKEFQITENLAKFFKNKRCEDIEKICELCSFSDGIMELITQLRKRKMKIAIISNAFSPIVDYFNNKLKIDYTVCPILEMEGNLYTGNVHFKKFYNENCEFGHAICKSLALEKLSENENIQLKECIAVGNAKTDLCMLRIAGIGILINPSKDLKNRKFHEIKNLKEILKFLD